MFPTLSSAVILCLAVSLSNVHADHNDLCKNVDCNGNGICEVIFRPPKPAKSKCKCKDGFRGPLCQVEVMLSQRCYFRPNSPLEKQISGIDLCPVGQFCLPDNFYCTFYGCSNSIGWCIKAAVITSAAEQSENWKIPHKDTPVMNRRGKNLGREVLDADDQQSQEDESQED